MKYLLSIFILSAGVFAAAQYKGQCDLEERAVTAVCILLSIYVRTPSQDLKIVYANAWMGNVCMEYVGDDAREHSFIRYAVFEKDSKLEITYDLDREDIEDTCNVAGVNLTNIAEKEVKADSENGEPK